MCENQNRDRYAIQHPVCAHDLQHGETFTIVTTYYNNEPNLPIVLHGRFVRIWSRDGFDAVEFDLLINGEDPHYAEGYNLYLDQGGRTLYRGT